jgi:hypothetical protein
MAPEAGQRNLMQDFILSLNVKKAANSAAMIQRLILFFLLHEFTEIDAIFN